MRRFLAASAFLLALGATPSMARDYPWCARTPMTGGNPQCMYTSFRQCLATVTGLGGDCIQNPGLAFDEGRNGRYGRPQDPRWRGGDRQNDGWNDRDNRRW
jgi:hypothetical protein